MKMAPLPQIARFPAGLKWHLEKRKELRVRCDRARARMLEDDRSARISVRRGNAGATKPGHEDP